CPSSTPAPSSFPTRRASDLKACVQHELRRARGVLVLISLSCNSTIVHDLRSILNVVHPHIGAQTPSACITTYDDALVREVRVERSEEHTSELQSRENLVCRL